MVYESDFYTTRRPYSRATPSLSSYTVTTRHIPYVAHMRLTPVTAPPHIYRPSVMYAEFDRINAKVRPSVGFVAAEDYFNDRSIVSFSDETRSIRAQTAALLKRIHTPIPRARKPLPVISTGYEYEETPIPHRITSDAYIQRLLGTRDVQRNINTMSHYNEPGKAYIGKGHLACVSFAGGRAYDKRRNLAAVDDDRVRNDVNLLSHYERMREAAASPNVDVQGTEETA